MGIKHHFGLVSDVQDVLTVKFFKAVTCPKPPTVSKARQSRRLKNLWSDNMVVVEAAVLRGCQSVVSSME